ncbi:MAG: endolytic transglycosylase MltG [Anaerovoracaceae bacterium]
MEDVKKNKVRMIIIILVVSIIVFGGVLFYLMGIAASGTEKKGVAIEVKDGMGGLQILTMMNKQGLINNPLCGKIYVRLAAPEKLQMGTYIFNKTMSLPEMLKAIGDGDANYMAKRQLKVLEGITLPEIAQTIDNTFGIKKEEVLKAWADKAYLQTLIDKYWFLTSDILKDGIMHPLEGYLYPDTYYVSTEKPTIEEVTNLMLDGMDKNLTKVKDKISTMDMSVHEFVTFASIVQAESGQAEDTNMRIAGVFKNRLDQDMPLQSDITVNYAKKQRRVDVSISDTKVDSLYNTYKHPGLPIGPVCSVPLATMEACVNYEKTDYLFFFATKDGTVLFTKTYAEHQKVVEKNKWY